MRILNPKYADPTAARKATIGARIDTFFTANPGRVAVTFLEVRAALPADMQADLTPAMLDEIAAANGWKVQGLRDASE